MPIIRRKGIKNLFEKKQEFIEETMELNIAKFSKFSYLEHFILNFSGTEKLSLHNGRALLNTLAYSSILATSSMFLRSDTDYLLLEHFRIEDIFLTNLIL